MSAANSAARKRRAQEPPSLPQPIQSRVLPNQQQQQSSGLTLPQVIGLIDSRLTKLELITSTNTIVDSNDQLNQENTEEFETRFDILAEEISNLKQIVLSLQSYTMDVNKILFDEKTKNNTVLDISGEGEVKTHNN
jgi:hypothetical protein